jgi:hypothetical protein
MAIREKLQEDWIIALKAKDKARANTISMAKAAVLQLEKAGPKKVEDSDVIDVIAKEVKQRRESIIEFEKGKRQDLVDQYSKEIEILLDYLPQQLNDNEIYDIVKELAVEVGANSIKDLGKLMSVVTPKTKGRADGKRVNQIVRELLNK